MRSDHQIHSPAPLTRRPRLHGRLLSLLLPIALGVCACSGDAESPPPTPSAASETSGADDGAAAEPSSPSPDEAAGLLFTDVTARWGVDFVHDAGEGGELLFPEMMGGGVAVLDADADGDLDLYFVNGAAELGSGSAGGPTNRLYLQGEDGIFVDSTAGSGLGDPGYGTGVAVGDINNDGHEDVFVANIGGDKLFIGRGDGTFEDVTAAAGLRDSGDPNREWTSSAAFCDLDRDGFLDLYIAGYVIFDPSVSCTDKAGRPEYCGPDSFEDRVDVLLRNRGDGTFEDVTERAGLGVVTGAGLGVVCEDFDEDGWVDVYVANDGDPNQLWINQKDGTFLDDALIMGTSVNASGLYEAGMGVVAADFDNDLDFDLFITHLRDETNTFYRNLGPGVGFEDQSTRAGLAVASTPYTGFGTAPFDADLDGDLDLVVVNGRVTRGEPLTDHLAAAWNPYAEPNLVYWNDGSGFSLAGGEASALTAPIEVSRSLATGDLDGDGDLDLVIGNIESAVQIYRGEAGGHWLTVDAVDPRLGGRRALGARVTLTGAQEGPAASPGTQVRTIQGAMSYLASSDP
ncbi:MAG: VCBS repeat-containing protein, partial [Acidobacteriota bacterium]